MSVVPNTNPGVWNVQILKGATWPGTTVSLSRDGVVIIPSSATVTIYDPENGSTLQSISVSIDGGTGLMTVASLSAATTAALTWQYGNILLRTTEGSGRVTDLLAGNATVLNLAD